MKLLSFASIFLLLIQLNTLSGCLKIKSPFSIARRLPRRDFITARNDSYGSGCLNDKNSVVG
ncbi:MAG: hypothetical protein IJR44_04295 [Neisseriaceae bacterium]|nr:hypothetical protein [Neisseriaceae bacterium]